jgi:hypothetical protein
MLYTVVENSDTTFVEECTCIGNIERMQLSSGMSPSLHGAPVEQCT